MFLNRFPIISHPISGAFANKPHEEKIGPEIFQRDEYCPDNLNEITFLDLLAISTVAAQYLARLSVRLGTLKELFPSMGPSGCLLWA